MTRSIICKSDLEVNLINNTKSGKQYGTDEESR